MLQIGSPAFMAYGPGAGRMGHASVVAANRYMHTVEGRDAEIAVALSEIAAHGSSAKLPRTLVTK